MSKQDLLKWTFLGCLYYLQDHGLLLALQKGVFIIRRTGPVSGVYDGDVCSHDCHLQVRAELKGAVPYSFGAKLTTHRY